MDMAPRNTTKHKSSVRFQLNATGTVIASNNEALDRALVPLAGTSI
jgi:hypothetical protein